MGSAFLPLLWAGCVLGPGEPATGKAATGKAVAGEPVAVCPSFLYQPKYSIHDEPCGPAVAYVPQPGDIMLATDSSCFWTITHNLALAGQPHNSGIVVACPDGSLGILEAGPNDTLKVRVLEMWCHLKEYEDKGPVWIRKRCIPLTCEQSAALTDFAMRQNGKRFALARLGGQLTIFRSRGPLRTHFLGKPQGDRCSYFCSELVCEALVAAGLVDPATARPAATYPRDLFFDKSWNLYLRRHFSLAGCWEPPARWTCRPCGPVIVPAACEPPSEPLPPPRLGPPLTAPPPRSSQRVSESAR